MSKHVYSRILIYILCLSSHQFCLSDTSGLANIQFEKLSSEQSGIGFNNRIIEDEVHNFFNFPYVYNGGGVAIGDINHDGLLDIYFSGNQVENKLYLNKGQFQFTDISSTAFPSGASNWSNGVSMVDINNDGWLDIYLCRSGLYQQADRRNLLFINNGDSSFSEQAKQYGLDDAGFSVQAYFLDYDHDNDLDLFLVNHRYDFENNNTVIARDKIAYDQFSSDQLYRNNGDGTFSNVTKQSGIINYAWGLSAAISDFNNDGWDDIYIANDYIEPDNLYINNQNGTFTESIASHVKHTSYYAMGSDLGDINNDGFEDLIVVDMVPDDHVRAKRMMTPMSTENFWRMIDSGLHYQYMLNTLQLNHGNGYYSEIAQLSGVSKTDWSWAPLFADFDNDGWQDLFISNGIKRDITDNDFFNQLNRLSTAQNKSISFQDAIAQMPASMLQNYLYRNQGDLSFQQVNAASHLTDLSNSNGAAYADLDNDGDLDLVVNNLDDLAGVYRNISKPQAGNYLNIQLAGPKHNRLGIGANIRLSYAGKQQFQKQVLARGYLSSVAPQRHFGLGAQQVVDTISVQWPDGRVTVKHHVKANQTLNISYVDSKPAAPQAKQHTQFKDITQQTTIQYRHQEKPYNDFKRELLLPHKQSENGPFMTVGDVNADQLEDFFIGGAAGSAGQLLLQTADQQFIPSQSQPWLAHAASEDLGTLLFDADNDKDLDLYVSSGSNEFPIDSSLYADRLYLNDGKGNFQHAKHLPAIHSSTQSVVAGDYDGDGDLDLFVGGRVIPGRYPQAPQSYLLRNDAGKFSDVTATIAAAISNIGMVTDADFVDYDKDGDLDLLLVGEWMPITLLENQQGRFVDVSNQLGLAHTSGWWKSIQHADFDADGDMDFIAGNIGKNNKYQPSKSKPLTVYANDFDNNGSLDIILAKNQYNRDLPIRGRQCSAEQVPGLNSKFPSFKAFAEADLSSIYSAQKLSSALSLKAELFASVLIVNNGKAGFDIRPLTNRAQFSPISAVVIDDFNADQHLDILYTGNLYGAEVETVRYDAGIGGLLLGDGKLGFTAVNAMHSGFITAQNARDIQAIKLGKNKQRAVIVTNNNAPVQVFTSHSSSKSALNSGLLH